MGLAGGGLAELPIPDAMFDEPSNGGYANGGIVAFAGGNEVEDEDSNMLDPQGSLLQRLGHHLFIGGTPEEKAAAAQKARDFMRQTGRSVASDVVSASGVVPGSAGNKPKSSGPLFDFNNPNMISDLMYRTNPLARPAEAAQQPTMPSNQHSIYAPTAAEGAIPAPMPKPAPVAPKPVTPASSTITGKTPERKVLDASVKAKNAEAAPATEKPTNELDAALAQKTLLETLTGPLDKTSSNQLNAHLKEVLSPAYQDKQKKEDLWMSLAQIGFGMAGTQSPYFLQAVGQAGAAALPGMINAKKERKAELNTAIKSMADLENASNREKQNFAAAVVSMAQASTKNKLDREELDARIRDNAERIKLGWAEHQSTVAYQQGSLNVQTARNAIDKNQMTQNQAATLRAKALEQLQYTKGFSKMSPEEQAAAVEARFRMLTGSGEGSTVQGGLSPADRALIAKHLG